MGTSTQRSQEASKHIKPKYELWKSSATVYSAEKLSYLLSCGKLAHWLVCLPNFVIELASTHVKSRLQSILKKFNQRTSEELRY